MPKILFSKIAGVTYENRQEFVGLLMEGEYLDLMREADNPWDPNAIAVFAGVKKIGYIPRSFAAALAKEMDEGYGVSVIVKNITGGNGMSLGVNVCVEIYQPNEEMRCHDSSLRNSRERQEIVRLFNDSKSQEKLHKWADERRAQAKEDADFSAFLRENFKP